MSKHTLRRKGFTLVELLVVIGIIALLISILLPSLNRARETANRVKCGSNMRQIGQAILLYANENKGNYPRTKYNSTVSTANGQFDITNSSNPVDIMSSPGTPGPYKDNDVCRAIFMLIRTQDITPEVFVCPSSNDEKDVYGAAAGISAQCKVSFTKPTNLSYSMANPYPDANAVNNSYKLNVTTGAEFAIFADKNPAGASGYDLTQAFETSSSQFMQKANSPNHQGQGENVLYGDGHAEFQQNPFCGSKRDCIYTVSGSTNGTGDITTNRANPTSGGTCSPKWSGDSVLIPTANWQ